MSYLPLKMYATLDFIKVWSAYRPDSRMTRCQCVSGSQPLPKRAKHRHQDIPRGRRSHAWLSPRENINTLPPLSRGGTNILRFRDHASVKPAGFTTSTTFTFSLYVTLPCFFCLRFSSRAKNSSVTWHICGQSRVFLSSLIASTRHVSGKPSSAWSAFIFFCCNTTLWVVFL